MSELKTQEEIQQEVRNLEAQLEHYMQVDPQNVDKHNELANQISELKYSIGQIQEREVHTQEVNETNSDIAVAMFEALFPDTKAAEAKIGLTELGELRTDFYQLTDGALADRTKLMQEKHDKELAQKDEKIRLLSGQGMELQRQLDELKKENDDITAKYERDRDIFVEKEAQLASQRDEALANFNKLVIENGQYGNRISELTNQLDAAQRPREEAKPSQSFTDRMSEIKSKNEARIKSAAELALENSAPFRGKVEISLPEIKQQERPFQGESGNDTPSNNGNDQLPTAQVDATVGSQFPSAPNVGTVHAPGLGNQAQPTGVEMAEHSNDGKALEKTEAERIAELERRVEALEKDNKILTVDWPRSAEVA